MKNNVVIAVVCSTDYVYQGEKTRTKKYDYRLKPAKGIAKPADVYSQWFKAE